MPTLYGALGVEPDADEDAIVRAYRERVKRHHPDVTDSPDAREQFQRLTAAKEVLTDADERARYDRLGHETYARRYLGDSWPVEEPAEPSVEGAAGGETVSAAAERMASETATAAAEPRTQRTDRRDGYATAAEYYTPGQRVGADGRGSLGRTLGAVRDVLPWLLAHFALLAGALTLAVWLLVGSTDGGLPPVTAMIVAVTMVGATAGVSLLHVSATLFR